MRLTIAAVGRLKAGPERQLAERYLQLAGRAGRALGFRAVAVVEIEESRARAGERRRLEESIAIANVVPEQALRVLLDERGASPTSRDFATQLGRWRDDGRDDAVFIIGGADGLAPSLREAASLTLGFGAFTWPHQLARIMLLEQIYRAVTILGGHPYHRD